MFRKFFSWLLGLDQRPRPERPVSWQDLGTNTPMDQGDYHSGPEGYTPNTAYPETQYGSNFDEDAAWNEGEWQ